MPVARSRLLSILIVMMLAGCHGKDDTPDRMLMDPTEAAKLGYSVSWSTDLRIPINDVISHAAVVGDAVVTVEENSNLVASLSLRDGSIRWQRRVAARGNQIYEPYGSNDYVLLNSEWRMFRLDATTGEIQNVSDLAEAVTNSPAVVDNLAIFGGSTGRVFAHDINAGRQTWAYQLSAGIVAKPVAFGASVFVTDASGVYAMLTVRGGELQWIGRTFDRISAKPIVTNLGVFVASEDNTFYALQRVSGKDRWKFRATESLNRDPLAVRTTIFLPVPNVGLVALNAINGDKLWQLDTQAVPIAQIDRGLLLNERSRLTVIDPQTGDEVAQARTGQWIRKVLVGPNNSLILVSPYGKIQRLDARP